MTSICYISIQDDRSDLHMCDHIYINTIMSLLKLWNGQPILIGYLIWVWLSLLRLLHQLLF